METIRYPVWLPKEKGCDLVATEVRVRSVNESDAPLTIEWFGEDMDRKGNQCGSGAYPYRLHEGMLWMPALGYRAPSIDEVVMHMTGEAVSSELLYMLESGLVQFPWIRRPEVAERTDRILGGDDPAIRAVAPELADRLLLVDDTLWMRTNGPVLRMNRLGIDLTRIYYGSRNGRDVETMGVYDCTELSALMDSEQTDPHFAVAYGWSRCYARRGTRMHSRLPASTLAMVRDAVLDKTAERALWGYLWLARRFGSDATPDMVEVVLMVRQALDERWPGRPLDFMPTTYASRAPHLYARELPDAEPLLPVLSSIVRVADEHLPAWVASAFRLVLSQLDERREARARAMDDLVMVAF